MKIQGHPNICECLGCFDAFRPGTSQAQYIMIVMELIDGGEDPNAPPPPTGLGGGVGWMGGVGGVGWVRWGG